MLLNTKILKYLSVLHKFLNKYNCPFNIFLKILPDIILQSQLSNTQIITVIPFTI